MSDNTTMLYNAEAVLRQVAVRLTGGRITAKEALEEVNTVQELLRMVVQDGGGTLRHSTRPPVNEWKTQSDGEWKGTGR